MSRLIAMSALVVALLGTTTSVRAQKPGRITFRESIENSCEFIQVDGSTGLYKLVFKGTQACMDALGTAETRHWSAMRSCATYGGPGEMYLACTTQLHPVWKQMYPQLPDGIYRSPATANLTEGRPSHTYPDEA